MIRDPYSVERLVICAHAVSFLVARAWDRHTKRQAEKESTGEKGKERDYENENDCGKGR